MPEKFLYEYAVIRVVPRVEREEFVNVGVIVFCKRLRMIHVRFHLDAEKLRCLCPDIDLEAIESNLEAFRKIGCGDVAGGSISQEDPPSRFRWLTAVRSSVIQTSRPHQGFSHDLEKTTTQLFTEQVL